MTHQEVHQDRGLIWNTLHFFAFALPSQVQTETRLWFDGRLGSIPPASAWSLNTGRRRPMFKLFQSSVPTASLRSLSLNWSGATFLILTFPRQCPPMTVYESEPTSLAD